VDAAAPRLDRSADLRCEPRRPDDPRCAGEPSRVERAELDLDVRVLALEPLEPRRVDTAVDHEHALSEPGEVANGREPGLAEPDDERPAARRFSRLLRRPASAFALHHGHHQRIFRLASPTSTRITVMIQKRTITLGSAQPLSSK